MQRNYYLTILEGIVTECMNLITIVLPSGYDSMYVIEHCAELYTNFL